jgi:hypothetical protein
MPTDTMRSKRSRCRGSPAGGNRRGPRDPSPRPLSRQRELFFRERNSGDAGAADFGKVEPEAAPARADVEHARIRPREKLRGEVSLLGELCVVKRLFGMLEIGAAVLPVGIEEEGVELPVEIVMVGNIAARAGGRVELRQPAPEVAQQPLRAHPARRLAATVLREGKCEEIRNRALLDHKCPIHVAFADGKLGIEQHAHSAAAV